VAERWHAQTAGQLERESENIRKSSKAPSVSPVSLADRITLNRFSIFSESGQKHCLGCPFLWFVSFGQAKEMNAQIKKRS
jgi:hypothetical protein